MSEINTKPNISREEAYRWLKTNWKHLAQKGELSNALSRYFQKYYNEDKQNLELKVVETSPKIDGDLGYEIFTSPLKP